MSKEREKYYGTFEELYLENYRLLFVMAGDYSRDDHEKKDICALVWAKVAEDIPKYMAKSEKELRNYLRIMIRNTALNYLRKEEREKIKLKEAYELDTRESAGLKTEVFYLREARYLKDAIKVLLPEEKELIILRFYMGKKAGETGELLGITEGNVRIRQMRILAKLKREIQRLMKEEEVE